MRGGFVVWFLAVWLAAAGCLPAPGRDAGGQARGIRVADWDMSALWRAEVHGMGDEPAMYAGPVVPGAPAPRAAGRVRCTGMVLWLPGTIVFQGSHGPVSAAVTTKLPAGQYTVRHDAEKQVLRIAPWRPDWKLHVELAGTPQEKLLFEAYVANMTASIPLRVVAAGGHAAGQGGACAACTHVDTLAAGDGQILVDALSLGLPAPERGYWMRWAADLAAQVAWAERQTSLRDQVQALLATGGARSLPPWRTARAATRDPALRQSWASLSAWEKDLWRAYLAQYGETMEVTEPGQRDLHLTGRVRFSMALRMSPQYMKPGAREAAKHLFNDPMFIGATVGGITAYFMLFVVPEPILTKASAVLTTLALVSLAGFTASEIVALAHAWIRLDHESGQARTLGDLERAAARFGHAIGGSAVRILAVLATVSVGKALPGPPPPGGAPAPVVVRISTSAGGTAAVAIADLVEVGWAVQVLKNGAVILMATSAAGGGGSAAGPGRGTAANEPSGKPSSMRVETTGAAFAPHPAIEGIREPGPIRSFRSFQAFKKALGSAGPHHHWHHIVEQTPDNLAQFGPEALHNTANVIRLDSTIHRRISGHYSSRQASTDGQVARKWLSTKPIESQLEFGIDTLRKFGVIP